MRIQPSSLKPDINNVTLVPNLVLENFVLFSLKYVICVDM